MIALAQLNAMPATDFVAALGGVFEHSPWIAERVAAQRPFASRLDLHAAMCDAVARASEPEQLALIRAHPELAGRVAVRKELTAESTREQAGAGLDQCTPIEFARLQELNAAYNARFGFPFILAVRGHDRASILAAFAARVNNAVDEERRVALEQIGRIAFFRLNELVAAPLGAEIMAMHERLAAFNDEDGALTCTYLRPGQPPAASFIRFHMLPARL